jgi:hypothetical protein
MSESNILAWNRVVDPTIRVTVVCDESSNEYVLVFQRANLRVLTPKGPGFGYPPPGFCPLLCPPFFRCHLESMNPVSLVLTLAEHGSGVLLLLQYHESMKSLTGSLTARK